MIARPFARQPATIAVQSIRTCRSDRSRRPVRSRGWSQPNAAGYLWRKPGCFDRGTPRNAMLHTLKRAAPHGAAGLRGLLSQAERDFCVLWGLATLCAFVAAVFGLVVRDYFRGNAAD